MDTSHNGAGRQFLLGAVVGVVVLALVGGIYVWRFVRSAQLNMRCRYNLDKIRNAINIDDWARDAEGRRLWPDKLPELPDEVMTCAVCGKRYVYSPVTPSGKRLGPGSVPPDTRSSYFVLWCPEPCHQGRRALLYADTAIGASPDHVVNWSEQTARVRGAGPATPTTSAKSPETAGAILSGSTRPATRPGT